MRRLNTRFRKLLCPSRFYERYLSAPAAESDYTVKSLLEIHNGHGVTPLAHLTCISSTASMSKTSFSASKSGAVLKNIMVLRGDIPRTSLKARRFDYRHAADLIQDIKAHGDFLHWRRMLSGGACRIGNHAGGHCPPEMKVEAGDFLVTQMFFDNNILYNYLYRLRKALPSLSLPALCAGDKRQQIDGSAGLRHLPAAPLQSHCG